MNSQLIKSLAALQLLLAIGSYLAFGDPWPATSASIAMALALILFSRERIHDERVEHLKLKAISYGLVSGLLMTSVVNMFGKMLKGPAVWPSLSAFDALILVLLVALGLFHYWRWQDGRAERVNLRDAS